ncbi:MAG: zinc-ribbon domain-containing protein, partial [Lachnospiraceae bacterium]|nr:zinc-ribbon domain-containing protein [Lachnospiraceae bacterium]
MAFCSNCGNRIEEGTRFCMSCGTPVNTGSIDVEPAAQERAPQERAPQETVLPERPGNEAKKKKKNNNALIAVLVFLAAIVIGIMVLGKSLTDELKNASGEPIPK